MLNRRVSRVRINVGISSLVSILGASALSLMVASPASSANLMIAQNCGNIEILPNGQNLTYRRGQSWTTCSGYRFIFQSDGNLVLYSPSNKPLWHTATNGTGADLLAIQSDGNIVLYNQDKPVWQSNTCCRSGAFLSIQADGNVVMYESNGTPIFATNTDGGSPRPLNPGNKNFPLRGSNLTELGDHRRMETSITISNNGRIDGVTRIWTAKQWSGFTGAVAVVITDSAGNTLYVTEPRNYGVDCKRCPGPSDRTQQWADTVPSNVLNQVGGYSIVHTTNPRIRWGDWLRDAKEAAKEVKKAFD
jgi:hypothetical protein